jgi:hypothetical protein
MNHKLFITSPAFFVLASFIIGVLNFLDTLLRLLHFYMLNAVYPLGTYLKPISFYVQVVCLLLFLKSSWFTSKPTVSDQKLSRFFALQLISAVIVLLLYIDLQLLTATRRDSFRAFIELAFSLCYPLALLGTSFWLAWRLLTKKRWKSLPIVFVLIGLGYMMAVLESLYFWSQNYMEFAFPSIMAYIGMYAPQILMFFATVSAVLFLVLTRPVMESSLAFKSSLLLMVPAFAMPILWNSYKDGIINFVFMAFFYWGFGYAGYGWYSVSLYLVIVIAYFIILKELSRRLSPTLASTLILLGVASLPWNGVTLLSFGYSSIAGNLISLNSIVVGVELLTSHSR